MKKPLLSSIAAAMLLLPAAGAMLAVPTSAIAQPATPQLDSLRISADAGLRPGSRLTFRLTGSPRTRATVRIRGLQDSIELRETAPGVFVGDYTITRSDRIDRDSEVRATLRNGNRQASANYALGETMTAVVVPPPPPVAVLPPLRIERFGMLPVDRIEPGADLVFAVEGLPGANVSVDVPGANNDVRLRETRPGHYEGSYTIRRADTINPNRPFVATLRAGDRVVTSSLNMAVAPRPPVVEARPAAPIYRPLPLANMFPHEGDDVAGTLTISANFPDRGPGAVDPSSVRIILSGREMPSSDVQVSRDSFSFQALLAPGRATVEVIARDHSGAALRHAWSFEVH